MDHFSYRRQEAHWNDVLSTQLVEETTQKNKCGLKIQNLHFSDSELKELHQLIID